MPPFDHRFWLYATAGLLAAQVLLFWLSIDSLMIISIFCTASGSRLPDALSYVHLAYIGLFVFGIVSLAWRRGRAIYAGLICLALLALPVQVYLIRNGQLQCDGP
ncbi:hypothetical protein [Sphingomonas sp. G-3-2-10]|uniref:hypothetical protein n=1 Tax=Sphingomonas sp. G-3-2-10 TaxID=2728838 RepID=UPI00146E5166|nr:hypothetical protein [Sphingomonas sp. G-3-2-10]NML05195.1 DUF4175 domain-containing protein [Sphingomonas sp. G-3-2-10]